MNKNIARDYSEAFNAYNRAKLAFEGKGYVNNVKGGIVAKTITFQVTEACNLCCSYCYQIDKSPKRMEIDVAKKFIDLLIEDSYEENSYIYYKDTPAIIIEFIGGEPLLEINLISEIMDYFLMRLIQEKHIWAKTFIISMISNGVLYFDKDVQKFLNEYKEKCSFSISLDGCKELHDKCRVFHNGEGSYEKVVKACKHYMENFNPKMGTKMTFAPSNVDYTFKAIENLLNLGYKTIHANPIFEDGWEQHHATIYYNELKRVSDYILDNDLENTVDITVFDDRLFKQQSLEHNTNFCGTTGYMMALDWKGDIHPCLRFMKSSLGDDIKPYVMGSVKDGINKKPPHREKVDILSALTRRSQSTDECFNCPIGAGCGWCTAYNYQKFGTPDKRATNICGMHKARALANVYYWNKFYKKNNIAKKLEMNIPKEWALEIITEQEYEKLKNLNKNN